jgi:hypothetical protein
MKFQRTAVLAALTVALCTAAYAQASDSMIGQGTVNQNFTGPMGQDDDQFVKPGTNIFQPVSYAANWRYRFYNGQWWYWMPANYWMYYSGNAWVPYNAVTYRRSPVIVNRGPYYYGNGYYGNYWRPGYSYYRYPGYRYRYWDGYYGYRPGYSYYRGPGFYGPYRNYGYGFRGPGVRVGVGVGRAWR